MSSLLFDPAPGKLIAIATQTAKIMSFTLDSFEATGVLTSIQIQQGVAAQFQPSLDGVLYVTPFGDKLGTATAGFILNPELCGKGDSGRGIDSFMRTYAEKRLSPANVKPLRLTIGNTTYRGFAIGLRIDANADNGYMIRGTLDFVAWVSTGGVWV